MQGLLKTLGQSFLTHLLKSASSWRRLEVSVHRVDGAPAVVSAILLLLTSNPVLARVTTIELSPLVYKSALIAPVDENGEIGVVLALPSADPSGLANFVKHVSTPGDPLFHHYITREQFGQKFGGRRS